MRAGPVLFVLAALLAAPHASALPWETEIGLAPQRVGDVYRYEHTWTEGGITSVEDVVIRVESTAVAAVDRFGLARTVDAYRLDRYADGNLSYAETCRALVGSRDAVSRAVHAGGWQLQNWGAARSWVAVTRPGTNTEGALAHTTTPDACEGRAPLAGTRHREGAVLDVRDLVPPAPREPPILSAPAEGTTWHGRPALAFTFDLAPLFSEHDRLSGEARVVLADGIPGYVDLVASFRDRSGAEASFVSALVAYQAAESDAAAIGPVGPERMPTRNPAASYTRLDRLRLDDEAFGLAYPYADAFAALRADMRTGFDAWLARHPDAVLEHAGYARYFEDRETPALVGPGWNLVFSSAKDAMCLSTLRLDAVAAVPAFAQPTRNHAESCPGKRFFPVGSEPIVASSHDIARAIRANGYTLAEVGGFSYWPGHAPGEEIRPSFILEDTAVPPGRPARADGHSFWFDAREGGLGIVFAQTQWIDGDILPLPHAGIPPASSGMSVALLDLPPWGLGLGVAGLALVAFFAGLAAAPLYTRLVRHRLLEHPVRARLHAIVKAEPGVHQAALIERAGAANGATRQHLDQLARHGLVVAAHEAGYVRYYASGALPPAAARAHAILAAGSHRAVYELYRARPDASLREAARELGMTAPSVFRAKRKLEGAGILPAREAEVGARV